MPFTPFHFGPGILIKSIAPRIFSFRVFILANIIIDAEVIYYAMIGDPHLHQFLHTYLGASVVALVLIMGRPAWEWGTRVWNQLFTFWRLDNEKISTPALAAGALFGACNQVLLDSIMHTDVRPFHPFSENNSLLHTISYNQLHLFCVITGCAGIVFYFIKRSNNDS